MEEEFLNAIIQDKKKEGVLDTNLISDGYHTFGELYEQRIRLYIELCRALSSAGGHIVWVSMRHSNNSVTPGWMIMGISYEKGNQITYHLPDRHWAECSEFARSIYQDPEYDGHKSADTLTRLNNLKNV
jgi:hypothetical protein